MPIRRFLRKFWLSGGEYPFQKDVSTVFVLYSETVRPVFGRFDGWKTRRG